MGEVILVQLKHVITTAPLFFCFIRVSIESYVIVFLFFLIASILLYYMGCYFFGISVSSKSILRNEILQVISVMNRNGLKHVSINGTIKGSTAYQGKE